MSTKRPPPSVRQSPASTFVDVIFAATGSAVAVKAIDATAIVAAIFVRNIDTRDGASPRQEPLATPSCKSLA